METMDCASLRDELIEVLYGEASSEAVRRVDAHCASCASCRGEIVAFRRVRQDLSAWRIPETAPRAPRRPWTSTGRLAAAAALLVALGSAGGFALAEARFARALDAHEARFQKEISAVRAEIKALPASNDGAVLAQVDERIRLAEERQGMILRASLSELNDRTEAQRRYDLARMSAGLSYLEGRTGQNMARATQLMGYVLQASEKR
jgi:hypothetical protein